MNFGMRWNWIAATRMALAVTLALPAHAQTTLQQVDQVIAKSGSLKAFLKDPAAQTKYYQALKKYFGSDQFTRDKYDAILNQLQDLVKKVPALAPRLWETTELGSYFSIESQLKTSGRSLDVEKWDSYFSDWREALDINSAGLGEGKNFALAEFLEWQRGHQAEFEAFNNSIRSKTKSEQEVLRGKWFQTQRNNPKVRAWANYFLNFYFRMEQNRDPFVSGDPDIILDAVEELRRDVKEKVVFRAGLQSEPPPVITSAIRDLIPSKAALLDRTDLFPVKMIKTSRGKWIPAGSGGMKTYEFVPLPRRIHGIWKGIPLGECVGGGDLDALSPQRWATVALAGTQLHYLQQGDSYLGFVQLVPISYRGQTYGSVDFGANALIRKTFYSKGTSQKLSSAILFDLWYPQARKQLPSDWAGIIVSESDAINNAGVVSKVREMSKYLLGSEIADTRSFRRTDPLANEIIRYGKGNPDYAAYSGRMIFDGMMKDGGALRLLVNADPNLGQNARKLSAGLMNGSADYQRSLIELLKSNSTNDPLVIRALIQIMHENINGNRKTARSELLSPKRVQDPEHLKLLAMHARELLESLDTKDPLSIFFDIRRLLEAFIGAGVQSAQLASKLIEIYFPNVDTTNSLSGRITMTEIVSFLSRSKLPDSEIRHLEQLLEKKTFKRRSLVLTILSGQDLNPKVRKEYFSELMQNLLPSAPNSKIGAAGLATETLKLYTSLYGWDKAALSWALKLVQSIGPETDDFDSVYEMIAKVSNLNSAIKAPLIRQAAMFPNYAHSWGPVLLKQPLTNEDIFGLLKALEASDDAEVTGQFLARLSMNAETTDRLLNVYLNSPREVFRSTLAQQLSTVERPVYDRAVAIANRIMTPKPVGPSILRLTSALKSEALARAFELITQLPHLAHLKKDQRVPHDLQLRALHYLEYPFPEEGFFKNIDFSDPQIGGKVQELILGGDIYFEDSVIEKSVEFQTVSRAFFREMKDNLKGRMTYAEPEIRVEHDRILREVQQKVVTDDPCNRIFG